MTTLMDRLDVADARRARRWDRMMALADRMAAKTGVLDAAVGRMLDREPGMLGDHFVGVNQMIDPEDRVEHAERWDGQG